MSLLLLPQGIEKSLRRITKALMDHPHTTRAVYSDVLSQHLGRKLSLTAPTVYGKHIHI